MPDYILHTHHRPMNVSTFESVKKKTCPPITKNEIRYYVEAMERRLPLQESVIMCAKNTDI